MKRLRLKLTLVITLATLLLAPGVALAGNPLKNAIGNGVCDASGAANCASNTASSSELTNTIKRIINVFSSIIGIVAVAMIMIGGFRYVTSAGNDQNVQAAKSTILYAVIGLVIVAVAQIIVRFVLKNVT